MNCALPFIDALRSTPEKLAVCEVEGVELKCAQLLEQIIGLAVELRKLGMRPEQRVLLQVLPGADFASSVLSVLLVGGVPVLTGPGFGDKLYKRQCEDSGVEWLLVHPRVRLAASLPCARGVAARMGIDIPPRPIGIPADRTVTIDSKILGGLRSSEIEKERFAPHEVNREELAAIVFTGGTTDAPKGVLLSHGALGYYLSNIRSALEGENLESFLADTPQQVLYAVRLGMTAHVIRGPKHKRPDRIYDLVTSGRIDSIFGTPHLFKEMMCLRRTRGERLPSSLKTILIGGAPASVDFLRELANWLHPKTVAKVLYGLTEAGPVCCIDSRLKSSYSGSGDLVGREIGDAKISIHSCDNGAVGEVKVESPSLFAGYLGRKPQKRGEWFGTGDLGMMVDVDGTQMLALMGRKKDMIIRRGINIYPSLLESQIEALVDKDGRRIVRECAMVGVWNEDLCDEEVALFVVGKGASKAHRAELKRLLPRVCGADGLPDRVCWLESIPRAGRQNKVEKNRLRKLAANQMFAGRGEA